MGAHPYCYFAPYESDLHSALQKLRLQEFSAGRYDPALRAPSPPTYTFQQSFPPGADFPSPDAQHASIDAAIEAAAESGTGSILDIFTISSRPASRSANLADEEALRLMFGTSTPTRGDCESLILNRAALARLPRERLQSVMGFWSQIGGTRHRCI